MSNHYFDDNFESFSILRNSVNSWIGTPYKHSGKQKNLGIDCVNFITQICFDAGIITKIEDYGYYSPDWYLTKDNAIIDSIDYYLENYINPGMVYTINVADLISHVGDLICLQIKSPVVNHVAIKFLGNSIVHANTRSKKVVEESIEGYLKYVKRIYSFWRVE